MSGRWTIKAFDTDVANKDETPKLTEAVYASNAGVMEVSKFYMNAPEEDVNHMERLEALSHDVGKSLKDRSNALYKAWKIVQDFNGVKLQGEGPWSDPDYLVKNPPEK